MKNTFIVLSMLGLANGLAATSALADNSTVEEALRSRADLSTFYQALLNTGVNRELQSSTAYTVFAPTNDAFAKIAPEQYPCFYNAACRLEVADIVRNHIVPGEVHMKDAVKQKGGLYSVDKRFINIGEPNRNSYTVDGKNITSTNLLAGSMLYKIDGVIANDRELAMFEYPHYAYVVPSEQVTTSMHTIRDPECTSGYCTAQKETMTITKTTTTPVLMPVPMMAPAR